MSQTKSNRAASARLTRDQQRRIDQAITAARNDTGGKQSAQASIPYIAMYPDGICRVTDRLYSKTIEYEDVNYQLESEDGRGAIYGSICSLYNYFDPSIGVQETFINRMAAKEEFYSAVGIPPAGDCADYIREEYSGILKRQYEQGNNGIRRTKLFTFAVEADSLKMAGARLARIEADILSHFKGLGSTARALPGKERLGAMHSILHLGTTDRFAFEWDWIAKTGMGTKDFIAPTSFHFGEGRSFRTGGKIGAVSFLQILASELSDRILSDFLEVDANLCVNLHIRSVDQGEAVKMIKRKITDIDAMKITEQKKAVRAGYDMDIMPSDLNTYGAEAKTLLMDLQSRNEKMFLITVLVMNMAGSKQALDNRIFQLSGIALKNNCALHRLDYMQEPGLMSSLPLGYNQIPIQRRLTTSGAAVFIPFISRDLFQGGEALYYGRNAVTGNMIMCDRKLLKNPKGLYCKGTEIIRNKQAVSPLRYKRFSTEPKKEGGTSDERNHILPLRRLPFAEYYTQRAAARTGRTPRQILPYAAGISAGTSTDYVQSATVIGAAIFPFARNRRSGAEQAGNDSRHRDSTRNNLRGIGLRLTEIPLFFSLPVQGDKQTPPTSEHAPTARGRSFINLFYNTRTQNSIWRGAGLCKAM